MLHPPEQDDSQIRLQGNPNESGFRRRAFVVVFRKPRCPTTAPFVQDLTTVGQLAHNLVPLLRRHAPPTADLFDAPIASRTQPCLGMDNTNVHAGALWFR